MVDSGKGEGHLDGVARPDQMISTGVVLDLAPGSAQPGDDRPIAVLVALHDRGGERYGIAGTSRQPRAETGWVLGPGRPLVGELALGGGEASGQALTGQIGAGARVGRKR